MTEESQRSVHRLRVAEVIRETADACSLVFALPPGGGFDYRPGQFLTLRVPVKGRPVARCYSLASSPHTEHTLRVTVKRVPTGLGSNWICDHVTEGTVLEVLPPAGAFTPRSLDDDLVLFAGGSGITPLISIVKSVLEAGTGLLALVYANRDDRSVIFARDLAALAASHPHRLVPTHWLESVQGLPTTAQLMELARPYAGREAFVCGPAPFMDTVQEALRRLGVPRRRIHIERYVSLSEDPFQSGPTPTTATEGDEAALDVELDGQTYHLVWPRQTPLLDLLLAKGLEAPFSCREGACSACACRIEAGEVKLLRNEVLNEEDLADGYVLACQAVPVSETVRVAYS